MSESKRDRKSKKRLFENDASQNKTISIVTAGMLLSDRYFLKEEIARGGMGVVFLAEDRELEDNIVAIKVLPPELSHNAKAQQRLRKEALAAIKLSHPNILRLHSFETDGQTVYLVMEYLNGGTLEDASFFGSLDVEAVLGVASDICSALDFAHSHGVIHRDIKPANLMLHELSNKQYAKLADLGIAFVIKDSMTRLTNVEAAGTLLYIAPEQLLGKRPSALSDQYSLAATFYEMISGEPPFFGPAVSHQIAHGTPELIEGIPEHINDALQKGLAKNPADRFDCCMDMYKALSGDLVVSSSSTEDLSSAATIITGTGSAKISKDDGASSTEKAGDDESSGDSIVSWVKANKPLAGFGTVIILLLVFIAINLGRLPVKTVGPKPSSVLSASTSQSGTALVKNQQSAGQSASVQLEPARPSVPVKSPVTATKKPVKNEDSSTSLWGYDTRKITPPPSSEEDASVDRAAAEEKVDKPVTPLAKPEFTNSLGVKLVLLKAGTFMQGSASSGDDDERPKHVVKIKDDFWISSTEITNKVWKKVMGNLPSRSYTGDNLPVTSVSFNEAIEFCRRLTEKENTSTGSSNGEYTLPSESQWEYAARGGSTSFSPGDGVWSSANSGGKPGAVMNFAPNRFGLYDMSGSVWEWTHDYWHSTYDGAPVDGTPWNYDGDIDYRVIRGGSWDFPQKNCRYSVRLFEVPYKKRQDIGLRVVFNPAD